MIDVSPVFVAPRINQTEPNLILNSSNLHSIPCEIDYDGEAKVSSYFIITEIPSQSKSNNSESAKNIPSLLAEDTPMVSFDTSNVESE
ncbi:hypothetical protein HK096_007956 [Nowakowskiella sp. JEL0078]|nr:hypothetical protein HK096_007956 [Nowakowskiella sp. JEL0078]